MREKILLDAGWLFHLGDIHEEAPLHKTPMYLHAKAQRALWGPACPEYRAGVYCGVTDGAEMKPETWLPVQLPHDYVISGTPSQNENCTLGYLPYDNAWYRKTFFLPESDLGRRLTILFEAVAVNCQVWLNGCLLLRHFGGYDSFEADITDVARYGEDNVLAVYVDARDHEGWWYEGAGIYRHVWLRKTDKVAVELWGIFAAPRKTDAGWETPVSVTVRNDEDTDKAVSALCRILTPDGEEKGSVTLTGTVPFRGKTELKGVICAFVPHLWDLDDTYQYTMAVTLSTGDEDAAHFGYREFRLDPDCGLFLNGKHVKIKGVCGHADTGLLGKAVPDNIQRYKVQLMKEMGANGFRCSHYPHGEATMDALDDMGFIVMDEVRRYESTPEGLAAMETTIRRDRNRPSVLFWSIGNEEPLHITEQGRRICRTMLGIARRLDPTRPVMTAVSYDPDKATVYDELDALGINYNLPLYDAIHEKYPDKAIFASECCATGTTRGWYFPSDPRRGYMSAYDAVLEGAWFMSREITWKHLTARPWCLGGYQWIAFEHRGETQWPRLCSQSGAIDLFLQKKDAFYQNQSHWIENRPVCHLLPHWNFRGLEGMPVRVVVYTNCPGAELFCNGESMGRVEIEQYGHGEWSVPYTPGKLEVVCYDGSGNIVCRDSRETTGLPARLRLHGDNAVTPNGEDVLIVTATVEDREGREVPDGETVVSFSCTKEGVIVGTGSDVCDHAPVPKPVRRMRAGRCAAAVRVGTNAGILRILATAPDLDSAVLEVPLTGKSNTIL